MTVLFWAFQKSWLLRLSGLFSLPSHGTEIQTFFCFVSFFFFEMVTQSEFVTVKIKN